MANFGGLSRLRRLGNFGVVTLGVVFVFFFSDLHADLDEDDTVSSANSKKGPSAQELKNIEQVKAQVETVELKKIQNVKQEKKEGSVSEKPREPSKSAKKREPIDYTCDDFEIRINEGIGLLERNVKVVQGDLKIHADSAKFFFVEPNREITQIEANGNVKLWKQDPISQQVVFAQADRALYDNVNQVVSLLGNAEITRDDDKIEGNKIVYNLLSGWIQASKVEGTLAPEKE